LPQVKFLIGCLILLKQCDAQITRSVIYSYQRLLHSQ
jgi:hypothetical protein